MKETTRRLAQNRARVNARPPRENAGSRAAVGKVRVGERGGADFQSRFDKFTALAEEMREGTLRVL
jgi:hypothetical protein